jgi:hypothetical protein
VGELLEEQGLGTINQRLGRVWMKIDEYHIGAGNDALSGNVEEVEYAVR